MSSCRPRAESMRERSPIDATDGRRPRPSGSRVAARRRSSYPLVPAGSQTSFSSPRSVVAPTMGSSSTDASSARASPEGPRALSSPSARSSRRRFSSRVDGTMSTPRVVSSAPWMTRPKAADDDVGDPLAIEHCQHRERIEAWAEAQPPRVFSSVRTRASSRSTRRSGERLRFCSSRASWLLSRGTRISGRSNPQALTTSRRLSTLGETAPCSHRAMTERSRPVRSPSSV